MSKYNVEYALNLKDRVSGQLKGIGQQMGKLDGIASAIGGELAGFATVAGLTALAHKVVTTTAEFERLRTVLNTSFGSNAAADVAFKQIVDFATKTPFQVNELTDSFVKLKNRGFEPTEKEMTKLGDLAAGQGKSFLQLTEALLDAQTGEFERLKEFGIKANKEGDKVRFTFKGVTKEVDYTTDAITNAVLEMGAMEGVAGGMEAQSKTLGGQLSNLADTVDQFSYAVGNLLTMGGKGSGGVLGSFGNYIADWTNGIDNLSRISNDADLNTFEKAGEIAQNYALMAAKAVPLFGWFHDIDQYSSNMDGMLGRIDGARKMFDEMGDSQKRFYSEMLQQEKYNKLWERNAELMGMSVEKFKEYIGLQKVGESGGVVDTIETLEKQIKGLKDEQKGVSTRTEFQSRQKQIDALQKRIDAITGKSTGKRGGGSGSSATSSTLTSRSPQTFNINITKLVETINTTKPQLNTTDSQTMRQITEALVSAVNDVQNTVK